jgi:DNA-binding MarR family transcriptional regulator
MTEPAWLNAREMEAWLALLTISDRLPAAIDAQLRRDHGLSRFEYYVLAMLSEAEDGCHPMTELSFLTNGSLSRLSHAVSKMQGRGLVDRSPDPQDGRTTLVTLTRQGRALLEGAAPSHVAEVRRLVLDVVPPEWVAELGAMLRPVVMRLLGDDAAPPPWEVEVTRRDP